jgi:hypothetical protein
LQVAPPRQEDAMPADSSASEYTESHYYLQAVAALARQQTVTAHEDIYCDTGMKLVAKGTAWAKNSSSGWRATSSTNRSTIC